MRGVRHEGRLRTKEREKAQSSDALVKDTLLVAEGDDLQGEAHSGRGEGLPPLRVPLLAAPQGLGPPQLVDEVVEVVLSAQSHPRDQPAQEKTRGKQACEKALHLSPSETELTLGMAVKSMVSSAARSVSPSTRGIAELARMLSRFTCSRPFNTTDDLLSLELGTSRLFRSAKDT